MFASCVDNTEWGREGVLRGIGGELTLKKDKIPLNLHRIFLFFFENLVVLV